ncbi:hypothetical protein NE237_027576 [Protea cynaroides]|uniref:Uncharacterized protein n=1 Tax=Protea cynaroides TaxID=273540 RepID=A0A9Q0GNT3_9MAGN|nr:hypothetical protein NE237_027576 [Protea cynaroides]
MKYHGLLFDFPFFTRKHDSFDSSMCVNNMNNLTLAYDGKDPLFEEGIEVLIKKRESKKYIAAYLKWKRIRPDLVLRLQIGERKHRPCDLQESVRNEVDQQQQKIMAMPDKPYRKFVWLCERQCVDLAKQVQLSQKMKGEKQLKLIFQWHKKFLLRLIWPFVMQGLHAIRICQIS